MTSQEGNEQRKDGISSVRRASKLPWVAGVLAACLLVTLTVLDLVVGTSVFAAPIVFLSVFAAAALAVALSALRKSEVTNRTITGEALNLLRDKRTLEYQQDRIRRIVDNAADAYVEVDNSGSVTRWNPKAVEMFGRDDVKGFCALAKIFDSETLVFLDHFWKDPSRFNGVVKETMANHIAGHAFPIEMTVWVDESDLEPKMSMFVRDITVRRETQQRLQNALEEERRAVMRLQEIDSAKNNFVSSISHELRSPLTSTLGYLELLSDGDAGELSERQMKMVQTAERNAKRLLLLIEDLLTLSHIESGTFGIKYTPVSIRNALHAATSRQVDLAAQRNVTLEMKFEGTLGVCPGDESQLIRALSSVINNAVKFTPPAGHVSITAKSEIEAVVVTIQDNGIGIPKQELHHLFKRFYRTSTSIDQQHQGAGLGLTITNAIVEHHGGSVSLDSDEGEGTTVTIRLPMLPSVHEISPAQELTAGTGEATA